MKIDQWPGRISNADPHDIPQGAAQWQVNLQCLVPGVLSCRGGLVPISFSNSTTPVTYHTIGMYGVHRPEGEYIVYQLTDGSLHAGRTPS